MGQFANMTVTVGSGSYSPTTVFTADRIENGVATWYALGSGTSFATAPSFTQSLRRSNPSAVSKVQRTQHKLRIPHVDADGKVTHYNEFYLQTVIADISTATQRAEDFELFQKLLALANGPVHDSVASGLNVF